MAYVAPFSSYLAGTSWLYLTDARAKLLMLTCYLAGVFMVGSWTGMALFGLLLLSAYASARIPAKLALTGIAPLAFIVAFTLLANSLGFSPASMSPPPPLLLPEFSPLSEASLRQAMQLVSALPGLPSTAQQAPLLETAGFIPLLGSFGLRLHGLWRGLFLACRIILLFMATALITYTSTLVALSDAIVALLRPLQVLKLPSEDVALVFAIALRFIPLTAQEADNIMTAQRSRGAVFDQGGLARRARAWLTVLVPLFIKLFRRADRLAQAMESRCYSGQGRTRLRAASLTPRALSPALALAGLFVLTGILL